MATEQVIEATILSTEPDGGGWVKIRTDQGDFSTKFPEPVAEAQQHLGQRVLIAYEMGQASQGRNGQWYPAPRYFKRVSQPGYVQPQAQPQAMPQAMPQHPQQAMPQAPPRSSGPDEREMMIMRQAAAKCAVWTMPLVPSEQRTFQNQLAVAEAWVRYFVGGIAGTGLSAIPQQAALTQEQQMMAMGAPAQDDIPF